MGTFLRSLFYVGDAWGLVMLGAWVGLSLPWWAGIILGLAIVAGASWIFVAFEDLGKEPPLRIDIGLSFWGMGVILMSGQGIVFLVIVAAFFATCFTAILFALVSIRQKKPSPTS